MVKLALILMTVVLVPVASIAAYLQARPTDRADDQAGDSPAANAEFLHSVQVNPGPDVPRVEVSSPGSDGHLASVSCNTCHATRQPNAANRVSVDLNEFHRSVQVVHGDLSCLSCHNDANYEQLKLADGTAVEYAEVMLLCAQCHGKQMREFEHGAHGGMSGYWDLPRGPRSRNNCIDCHLAHRPKFPTMRPSFKPKDRFLEDKNHGESGHE